MAKVDPKDLLASGAHFGHKSSRWHPKMAPYIYGKRDGVHIIDITKTVDLLEDAKSFTEKTVSNGGDILLVGTKRQAEEILQGVHKATGMPYVTKRWIGGFLTNRSTMSHRIKQLKKIESQLEAGELDAKYNKLEVQRYEEEVNKFNEYFGGIKDMTQLPKAVFVVDVVRDSIAVREANRLHIPVIGICDTNADPRMIDYIIPANDDSIKTLELIAKELQTAIESGKTKRKSEPEEEEA